jgi:H+/Cl- antiporter ClcA
MSNMYNKWKSNSGRLYQLLPGYLAKWLLLATLTGALAGTASAFFLASLSWVTHFRETNTWIIWLLPLGGLVVGLSYHYLGTGVARGNNLLLDELHSPKQVIPVKMAPLVLFGTLVTHLVGGSAGREGTAVQMGGALAHQIGPWFRLRPPDHRILLIMGIGAGFASVFGTPLAGAIFALEVLALGSMRYDALVPAFLSAYIAHYICMLWGASHTAYQVGSVPPMQVVGFACTIAFGVACGLVARSFSVLTRYFSGLFQKSIAYPPLRPVVGGVVLALVITLLGTTRHIGLGLPVITQAFGHSVAPTDFALKILLTAFTLGAGFKGGEVTPLFFIGATLGSALAAIVPLPVSLLAAMGFAAVFAGATNTPVACLLMGIELFGSQCAVYLGLACVVAYLFSGHSGIYGAQVVGTAKHAALQGHQAQKLEDLE